MSTTDNRNAPRGRFVTRVVQTLTTGHQLVSLSRRHRKRLPPLHVTLDGRRVHRGSPRSPWLHLWAPDRLAWWIALLFIIGSACFAYGSFGANWPQYLPARMTEGAAINHVFFVGSIFFTAAAWLQLLEAVNGDVADVAILEARAPVNWRWFGWKPHNAGYLASLIQFGGTLLFNLNTGDAMLTGLGWTQEDVLIWTPDMAGSLCFLTASYLALVEIAHGWWSFEPRQVSWWVVILNLMGSVAFQVAAVYGFFPPPPEAGWAWSANLWTLIGALCFFLASYLMIPELFDADATAPSKALSSQQGRAGRGGRLAALPHPIRRGTWSRKRSKR